VVAATRQNLAAQVGRGLFHEDLYRLLSQNVIHLPSLAERPEDVPLLCRHFLRQFNQEYGKTVQSFSSTAERTLLGYPWPGNVRELENVIERAMILSDSDQIRLDLIDWMLGGSDASQAVANAAPEDLSIKRQTAALEKKLIAIALDRCGGNRIRAARVLELSHRALLYKIKEYELGG
jgi:two-component system response regulator AtoC